ncbi:MAG: TerB family tellurite resistance protein [Cyclobacteriaceae bacterium]|nr:TerB family tellurite resistance protein [Cyclobacteriaceae bacterium]MBX2956585.1 TerB family tellurite resistance protein [Cyclobacteriaceae bacterium]
MALSQLKLLVNLARIDGDIADRERKYITTIGLANGVPMEDIVSLFNQDHENIGLMHLTNNEKFDYIVSLVQLMKIDERLYQEEIKYCSEVAARLGYDQTVMFDLMLHVREEMQRNELQALKKITEKYLSK